MRPRGVIARLLVALAGASPAFGPQPRVGGRGPFDSLLTALARGTPAFGHPSIAGNSAVQTGGSRGPGGGSPQGPDTGPVDDPEGALALETQLRHTARLIQSNYDGGTEARMESRSVATKTFPQWQPPGHQDPPVSLGPPDATYPDLNPPYDHQVPDNTKPPVDPTPPRPVNPKPPRPLKGRKTRISLITNARIRSALDVLGVSYVTDRDDSNLLTWDRHAVLIDVEGDRYDILVMRVRPNATIPLASAERAREALNEWNYSRRFSKAYIGDPTPHGRLPIYGEIQVPIVSGIEDKLLLEIIDIGLGVFSRFVNWLYDDARLL